MMLDPANLAAADLRENNRLWLEEGLVFSVTGGDSENTNLEIPTVRPDWCSCCCNVNGVGIIDPYSRIFAPYQRSALFAINESTNSVLSEVTALRALMSIMEAPTPDGGASLNLSSLMFDGKIERWLPGHSKPGQERLRTGWKGVHLPWRVPVDQVKDYLGERVGFYFAFLAHFSFWLILPSIVGIAVFIHQVISATPNTLYLPIYGVLVALWSTFFMEFWKRHQAMLEQKWGMSSFKSQEQLRAEYTSRVKRQERSYIDGKPTYLLSLGVSRIKRAVSGGITLTLLGVVIVVVASIFLIRVLLTKQSVSRGGKIPDGYPDYITSVINAVSIQLMAFIYGWLARVLTSWENHAVKSSYDNSLIIKLAVFNSINSYFPLMYIAAIKNSIVIDGEHQYCLPNSLGVPDCMKELQSQLGILIITKLVLSILFQYLLPLLTRTCCRCCARCRYRSDADKLEAYTKQQEAKLASPYEAEAGYPTYDPFDDYLELMLLFGYATLFVTAFPLAPVIVMIAVMSNVFIDWNRILKLTARPLPEGAQDIGSWQPVFETLCYISSITNLTVVVFTNTGPIFGRSYSYEERLIFFIIAEHIVLGAKFVIQSFIPDKTYHTSLQLKRQDYLVDKHIRGVKDVVVSAAATRGTRPSGGAAAAISVAKTWFAISGSPDPRSTTFVGAMMSGSNPHAARGTISVPLASQPRGVELAPASYAAPSLGSSSGAGAGAGAGSAGSAASYADARGDADRYGGASGV